MCFANYGKWKFSFVFNHQIVCLGLKVKFFLLGSTSINEEGKTRRKERLIPTEILVPLSSTMFFFYSMSLLCVGPFSSKMFSLIWTGIVSFFFSRDKIRATHLKSLANCCSFVLTML